MDFISIGLKFLSAIWSFVVALFNFLLDILSYIDLLFDYIVSIVLRLPSVLLTMYLYLPDFMQVGFLVITIAIVLVLVLKIIKLFRQSIAK